MFLIDILHLKSIPWKDFGNYHPKLASLHANNDRNNLDNRSGKSLFQTREDLERSPGKGIFFKWY